LEDYHVEHTTLINREWSLWYALFVKPQKEHSTKELLEQKGYETFLPICREWRRWADRRVIREKPAFPGYLFCSFNPRWRMPVLTTPGVLKIVGYAGNPEPIDDAELQAIKTIAASPLGYGPCPYLEAGRKVRILDGPLAGVTGILLDSKNGRRLGVSVSLMQRSVSVQLDHCSVEPIAAERRMSEAAMAYGSGIRLCAPDFR